MHFSAKRTAAEDRAFTKLVLTFQLVFRKALCGNSGWRAGAGRFDAVYARLKRAEAGHFTGLWEEIMKAHDTSVEQEVLAE